MPTEIVAGAVVRLKSGGPLMTVEKTFNGSGTGLLRARCTSFDDKHQVNHDSFPVDSLELQKD